ncbi:MAG: DUF4249 family protein [Bacteroidales bacterium]|nr:DUF4249 family protein [Candidatus Colimorpha onthohippi]
MNYIIKYSARYLVVCLFVSLTVLLCGCKADFSPNAEWKDVPVVYCILDQDDSVSYVRVQRCYLGEGDLMRYGAVYDSVNYPADALDVMILRWSDETQIGSYGAVPQDTLRFAYHIITDKVSGDFSYPNQPVYSRIRQQGDWVEGCVYQLVVKYKQTGEVLARSQTRLVGDCEAATWLSRPHPSMVGRQFSFTKDRNFQLEWYPFVLGRRYQLIVNFLYRYEYDHPEVLHRIPTSCSSVSSNMTESVLTTSLSHGAYLSNIESVLRGDTATKRFVDTVEVMMSVCNEPLHAYLNAISASAQAMQEQNQMYSNIEGGAGVFGARRSHLLLRCPTDRSSNGPYGMRYLIDQLKLNFVFTENRRD